MVKTIDSKKALKVAIVAVIALFGALAILIHKTDNKALNVPNNKIIGVVTKVVNIPNQSEDGYYGIVVKADSMTYTIDATGYLNTPASPDQFGETCVEVPTIKVGDSVEFNLPKSVSQQGTYDICYKKNLSGYFINLR